MPPTTTTTKASPIATRSVARLAGSRASCNAPPSPASAAPRANTDVNKTAWFTPSALTISRSWVAARKMQHQQDQRAQDDQEKVISWQLLSEDLNRPAQARRAWAKQILGAP